MELQRSTVLDPAEWSRALAALPDAHVLQTWEWGEFKAGYGWSAERLVWRTVDGRPAAAAQVLERRVRVPVLGLSSSVLYAPRGPLLDWRAVEVADHVLRDLHAMAARPGVLAAQDRPRPARGLRPGRQRRVRRRSHQRSRLIARLPSLGYRPSPEQVQFRNTFVLDLRPGEDRLLAGMKQKTRYNVRLAERHGVRVRAAGIDELPELYRMYAETSVRDGFTIRSPDYYRHVWGRFMQAGLAQPLVAQVDGEVVAGVDPLPPRPSSLVPVRHVA